MLFFLPERITHVHTFNAYYKYPKNNRISPRNDKIKRTLGVMDFIHRSKVSLRHSESSDSIPKNGTVFYQIVN